ncbi:MAG: CDP-glucose 4,6-dehydratase [Burkholderiales bacterium]|nr:CDP-glucose 4,6-dehydratase [Burkholderiales bacterium]
MEDLELSAACAGLFGGAYAGRRVLVTGHTGFKGSWLALWLRALGARVAGLALAPDTEPSHHRLLQPGAVDRPVDLRDARAVRALLADFAPEIVFHLAAQPLVRRGYAAPVDTFAANVTGLIHLLEAVRATPSVRAVVNATSDKCYLNHGRGQPFREDDPLGGSDPYSASKACAEIVSACWRASFLGQRPGRPVLLATARAGNVIGGGDWSEDRLVPDLVRAAVAGEALPIRSPHAVRPWQHVLEPLAGYLQLGQRLLAGDAGMARAWNFGPGQQGQLTVARLVEAFARCWPRLQVRIDTAPHPAEAARLLLDCRETRLQLGWRPVWNLAETVRRTADWYRGHAAVGAVDSRADLHAYIAAARASGLRWADAGSPAPATNAFAARAPAMGPAGATAAAGAGAASAVTAGEPGAGAAAEITHS